ncbi:MAG: transposase [Heteroscytonema crispum UTEX LB 1556]
MINLVSDWVADDVAVMQMDQGSLHRSKSIECPENIIPIFQPPHSPELNPIERFWQHLKAELQWQNCSTLNGLRDRLQKIIQQITPDFTASLIGWEFITAAVLSSSSRENWYNIIKTYPTKHTCDTRTATQKRPVGIVACSYWRYTSIS